MITFKILPLSNYTLIPAIFPVFITLLKGFDWKILDYPHHGALNFNNRLEMFYFHNLL